MLVEDLSFLNPLYKGNKDVIKNVCLNSKEITKGSLFIALKGRKSDGNDYIKEAINKEATLIMSDNQNSQYYIPNLKDKINQILWVYYGVKQKVKIIGITGTNGKSSLSSFIKQGLIYSKKKVMNFTTFEDKNGIRTNLTTPENLELIQNIIKYNNYDYLILECSSIGIAEKRINDINFDYKILTNIEKDHLDYHKNIENYIKTKLFFLSSRGGKVVMYEDDYDKYYDNFKGKFVFKINRNYKIIKEKLNYTIFKYNGIKYQTKLIGKKNIENLLICINVLKDMRLKKVKNIIKKINPLAGRMNVVSYNPLVIIDYAHTPSSMEYVLNEVRRITKKNIYLIFGAGGEREKDKRNEYGRIALKYSYHAIVTNDNPRNENEDEIIKDIIKDNKYKFIIIKDRSKAIHFCLNKMKSNDVLVILGKGNEDYIDIKGEKKPYSDYEEVKKWIKNYSSF